MRLKILVIGLLWTALTAASPAVAQIQVSAAVDRTTISPGETLQLKVRISGGKGDVDLSALSDFKVLSESTSTNVQIINNRMTREVAYNYVLTHLRKGSLTIPALTVTVDGQHHKTKPIAIIVADNPKAAGNSEKSGKEVWVTADVTGTAPYVGQQITYTLRFYRAVRIDDARFQHVPDFNGFSAKEIEERKSYRKGIDGREHVVTEVFFVLTPLKEGPQVIDPAVLHVGVVRTNRSRRRSPFDDFFNRNIVEPRELSTGPLEINVRPLPPLPSGQEFSGLVGRFQMTAHMESTQLKVGDSATLTITVQGAGNIMDARSPEVTLPEAFKSYADNPEEEINLSPMGTNGKKVFRTALVPVTPGKYTLPAIELVYFDIETGEYRPLSAQVPTIDVMPAPSRQSEPLTVTPGQRPPLKKRVAFTGRDILPPKESIGAIEPRKPMGWPLFLCAMIVPALAFGCSELVRRIRQPQTSVAAVMRNRAHQALKTAASADGQDFLSSLYQALTAAILSTAGRAGEALTWKEAESLLLDNGICREDAGHAARLLSDIESCKFSGVRLEENRKQNLLDQTRTVLRKLAP